MEGCAEAGHQESHREGERGGGDRNREAPVPELQIPQADEPHETGNTTMKSRHGVAYDAGHI